ncbi:MAG TPA: hypothetical protein V6D22_22680 [Candidatus Obscuribacterales bacterium]
MSRKIQMVSSLSLLSLVVLMGVSAAQAAPATAAAHGKSAATAAKPATQRSHHHPRIATRYHYKTMFVPPPPAVMPSILPELTARHMQGDDSVADDPEQQKPENPYKKYIHTPEGNAPAPIQTRKGVVIWAQRG